MSVQITTQPCRVSAPGQLILSVVALAFAPSEAFALHGPELLMVQAGTIQSDPVTGSWGADSVTSLELVHNGRGGVSGTVIFRQGRAYLHRARIDTGSFDARTGALVLEGVGVLPDGSRAAYAVIGKIARDTIRGRYRFDDDYRGLRGRLTYTRRTARRQAAVDISCRARRSTSTADLAGPCLRGDSTFGELTLRRASPDRSHLWIGTLRAAGLRSAASSGPTGQSEIGVDLRPGGALRLGRSWLALKDVRADSTVVAFSFQLDVSAPPTQEDVNILRRARAYLSNESRWNRSDTTDMGTAPTRGFTCAPAPRQSMFCAVYLASVDVAGDYAHFRPAIQELRKALAAAAKLPYRHPLVDFNNDPARTLKDIHDVLDAAAVSLSASRVTPDQE